MQDRLHDLKKGAATTPKPEYIAVNIKEVKENDIVTDFIQHVNLIQQSLRAVQENNQQILKLKEQHAVATLVSKEKEISANLNNFLNDSNNILERTKAILDKLKKDVDKCNEEEPEEPETRIKTTQYESLCVKFKNVLTEYQDLQLQFKNAVKSKVKRQVKALDSDLSAEELDRISDDPEGAAKMIQDKMIGRGHQRLQNAVADIQDKQRDIQRLEQSVALVIKLLQDMAYLVHLQGEQLDNIELNLNKAKNYVEKGVKQLDKAKVNHKKSRKRMCCVIIILLVIFVVLLSVLGGVKII